MDHEQGPRYGESNRDAHTVVGEQPGAEIVDAVVASAQAKSITLDDGQRELLDDVAQYLAGSLAQDALVRDAEAASRVQAGFFIHGPAGRGKTWLMTEILHAAPLPESAKRRVHFHTFFQELQRSLAGRLSARDAIEQTA